MSTKQEYYYFVIRMNRHEFWNKYSVFEYSHEEIIDTAEEMLNSAGQSMENYAGIEWIEDIDNEEDEGKYERELTDDELFYYSIKQLDSHYGCFIAFPMTREGAKDFLETSKEYFVHKQAKELVKNFLKYDKELRARKKEIEILKKEISINKKGGV